ncbi:MAG: penicillin-binding protein 2 [Candidatus Omnitrophota bacterium]
MRVKVFSLIIGSFIISLLAGLGYVQIVQHEKYRLMSEENRLKLAPLMAPRGTISDRRGRPIAKDLLSFSVFVIYSRVKDEEALTEIVSSVTEKSKEEIRSRMKEAKKNPYVPINIIQGIDIKKAISMEELRGSHPGLLVEVSSEREYLYGKTASSLLGHIGDINRNELDKLRSYGYRIDDRMGRSGIEKFYDDYLRGRNGGKQIEVDHVGREVNVLSFKEPVPGKDLELTIDIGLQQFCDELLEEKKGAIVVMDPATGEIIAMSSAPAYDPNVFIDQFRDDEVRAILTSEDYPLINRAITGVYPPGSVFKTVIAAGALEKNIILPDQEFLCSGKFNLGKTVFHCWRTNGHGPVALTDAIKGSCNVYFFNVGLACGADIISEYSEKMGFGKRTGIDLPGERAGTVPSPAWKKKKFKEAWYKGDTVNFSIGQGYLLCSPIQIACMVSVFANKGYLPKPYLVKKIEGIEINSPKMEYLGFSDRTIDKVREGMEKAVNDKRGTGIKAKLEEISVAGKTGTAQTSRGKSHGWFMGFAPFENAKLSVVVFDEYGGKGGYYAAETAGKVFKRAIELGIL